MANEPAIDAPASEWLVYADALQQKGDPRGELIALREKKDARDAFVKEKAAALLGEAGKHIASYALEWRWSYVDAAEVRVRPGQNAREIVDALLKLPAVRNLRRLTLTGIPEGGTRVDLQPAVGLLQGELPKTCVELALVDQRASEVSVLVSRDFDPAENLVGFGPLEVLPTHLRSLELVVADPHQLAFADPIALPELMSFRMRNLRFAEGYGDRTDLANRLAAARWPKLKSFEMHLVEQWVANTPDDGDAYVKPYTSRREDDEESEYYEGPDDGDNEGVNWGEHFGPVLEALAKLPLERLALHSIDSSRSFVEALLAAGVAPTLRELDLEGCTIDEDDLKALAPILASLKKPFVPPKARSAELRYVVGME